MLPWYVNSGLTKACWFVQSSVHMFDNAPGTRGSYCGCISPLETLIAIGLSLQKYMLDDVVHLQSIWTHDAAVEPIIYTD